MRSASQAELKAIGFAVLNVDRQEKAAYLKQAGQELDTLQSGFSFLLENYRGDKNPLEKAQTILAEAKPYREQIIAYVNGNQNDQAGQILFEKYQPRMLQLNDLLKAVDEEVHLAADQSFYASQASQKSVLVIQISISIITLAATLILALTITKSLVKPILEIEEAATKIADGDLTVKVSYQSKDELGILSEKIRHLTETLRAIIYDENYLLGEMARCNFAIDTKIESKYIGEFQAILTSMRNINLNLSDSLGLIHQSSNQVSNGSEQVSSGAQSLSQGAAEQASAVEELAATITEISSQIKSTAQNAEDASQQVTKAGDLVLVCNQQMNEMTAAMDEINQEAEDVKKIIKTIEDIAFQTNILALNAAVEAARAGAAGKGFAVVADEVRNLANKSAEASKNTSVLIAGAIGAIEKGIRIADETSVTLQQIVQRAQNITTIVGEITKAANEQANAAAQVTQGIDQISAVVQTNSATAEESAAVSEELSSQAAFLKNMIEKFQFRETVGTATK